MENPFEEEKQVAARPTFLTVLCILTFVGSGFMILIYLVMSFMPAGMADMMQEQIAQTMGEEKAEELAAFMVASLRMAPYALLLSIASLAGAILMFRLRRTGYFLYVAAQVILVVLPLMFCAQSSILGSAFWALLFIVLYGLNWKALK